MKMMMIYNENDLFNEQGSLADLGDETLPWNKPLFSIEKVKNNINHLAGKVLTLIDASITDPIQRKALKDRIKQDFLATHEWFLDTKEYSELIDAHNEAKHYANLMNEPTK